MTSTKEVNHEERPNVLLGSEDEPKIKSTKQELNDNDNNTDICTQCSPQGVLENSISGTDSDSGSSCEISCVESSSSSCWQNLIGGLLFRKKKPIVRLSTFPPLIRMDGDDPIEHKENKDEIVKRRPSWRSFDFQELAVATDNFSRDKLIGKGGHAEVYKGCLPDGQLVAVKRLTKRKTEDERIGDFLSELGIIAHVTHPNAAQFLGFGIEGGLHLVLQYSPHGSLASVLHGSKESLEWKVRFKIALGVAEGLLYLHERCHHRIIHRDIKASNILLTDDYQPLISDFGLAKWLPKKWSHHIVSPIEGTFGYLAPEYFMHGVVNEKIDVFAYGVLLLELTTGHRAVDSSLKSLVIWAKPLLDANNLKELKDPSLGDFYDLEQLKRTISVASMCVHHIPTARPTMNRIVRLLKGGEESIELVGRSTRLNVGRMTPLFDAGDWEGYTCSRYLNDLNRHKQLALEQ